MGFGIARVVLAWLLSMFRTRCCCFAVGGVKGSRKWFREVEEELQGGTLKSHFGASSALGDCASDGQKFLHNSNDECVQCTYMSSVLSSDVFNDLVEAKLGATRTTDAPIKC
jgi:hypothetical protein